MQFLLLATFVTGFVAAAPVADVVVARAHPTSVSSFPTSMPSSFPAPVQGHGALSLTNLPALPPVLDKTVAGVVDAVVGLLSGVCSAAYKCTITVSGSLEDLLVDGSSYSAAMTLSAWCDDGHCYGSADIPVTATAPFTITCDKLTGTKVCSATISGAASAIFSNGRDLELWGWLTPSGYCANGVCTASLSAYGDPMY